jgi:hypothetical protein
VCLLVLLIVLSMSSVVYSQTCTCEIVDPWPRYGSGEEKWLGGIADRGDRGIGVCVEHYYGDYKIIITYYDWDYNVLRKDEFVNPIMYQYNCFWTIPPMYTEVVRVDLVMLSDGEVYVYWDLCVICCQYTETTTITTTVTSTVTSTTTTTSTVTSTEIVESTITETHTETQFIHDSRAWIIILVFLIIVLLLKYFH